MRLVTGLGAIGANAKLVVKAMQCNDSNVISFVPHWTPSMRFIGYLRSKLIREEGRRSKACINVECSFSDSRSRFYSALDSLWERADLINLHWVFNDYFDYVGFFREMPPGVPVVWTLHDMAPFTGGCHHARECRGYLGSCGSCPLLKHPLLQVGSRYAKPVRDWSRKIWLYKKRGIDYALSRGVGLHIVSPSMWLARKSSESALFSELPTSVIPNAVDHNVFRPLCGNGFRDSIRVASDQFLLLFVASNVADPDKGFNLLMQAICKLDTKIRSQICLVTIGYGQCASNDGVDVRHLGCLESESILSLAYSAADMFVIPSNVENFPNTILESMACGTPVVGFDVGGIPEMVQSGQTGLLASVGDVSGLAEAIRSLMLDERLRRQMGGACRETVLREYTLERQARAYVTLYENMINEARESMTEDR